MNLQQWLSVTLLCAMMALFVWGRFRFDITAMIALLAGVVLGLVPPEKAFTGFSDDIVIIVGSALVLSAAVQRSGLVEAAVDRLARRLRRPGSQLFVLTGLVGAASGLIKNIGALAMLMPAATQLAKKSGTNPSRFFMPMAFASLLGGLTTLVGTSPNIIVSRVREEMTGKPFGMFDYLPTGLGLLVIGLVFLHLGRRLLPERQAPITMGQALNISAYTTEATVTPQATVIGDTVASFIESQEGDVEVTAVLRHGLRAQVRPDTLIEQDDILILMGDPDALERAIAATGLALHDPEDAGQAGDETGVIEAVVTAGSALVGSNAGRLMLKERLGIRLIGISREGSRLRNKPSGVKLVAGDILALQGILDAMPGQLSQLGLLPLAQRQIRLGRKRKGWLAIAIRCWPRPRASSRSHSRSLQGPVSSS
jgi:di/tricarboxylate transporter